ncbi:Leucine-rich repeat domain superfamily, partial [Sesbania bispinosa]
MNISSNSVTQFPNVSGAKNLRELRLDKCLKLVTVDGSVGFLPNLVYLRASECPQLRQFLPRICLPSLEYLSFNFCRGLTHFPDIVGKMDKPLKVSMIDTAITEFPESIDKLTGLNYLEMTVCKELQDLPSSLFILPNFVTLKIGGCSQLPESFRKFKESHLAAQCRPNLRTLHFGYADLLEEDIDAIIHIFPNLENLNVSGNNFVSLPAHIKGSVYLTSLDVSGCKLLKEIPELPSSVHKVDARKCDSISQNTSRMLWSQVRKEINRLEVKMPFIPFHEIDEIEEMVKQEALEKIEEITEAFEEYIKKQEALEKIEETTEAFEEIEKLIVMPTWFDHSNKRGIPVFRARGKFPVVVLAFVFGKVNDMAITSSFRDHMQVGLHLFIEGLHVHSSQCRKFILAKGHVLLCDLRVLFSEEEWEGLHARVGDDWKTVQVDCETDLSLFYWGVYVYKQETNMEDIEFDVQDPSSSGISRPWSLVSMNQEDKVRNMLACWDPMPKMYEKMLRDGSYYNMSALEMASRWRLSRRVMALREGKGASGSELEDEDEEEDDFMLQVHSRLVSGEGDEEIMVSLGFTWYPIITKILKSVVN